MPTRSAAKPTTTANPAARTGVQWEDAPDLGRTGPKDDKWSFIGNSRATYFIGKVCDAVKETDAEVANCSKSSVRILMISLAMSAGLRSDGVVWLARKDSNLRSPDPELNANQRLIRHRSERERWFERPHSGVNQAHIPALVRRIS